MDVVVVWAVWGSCGADRQGAVRVFDGNGKGLVALLVRVTEWRALGRWGWWLVVVGGVGGQYLP